MRAPGRVALIALVLPCLCSLPPARAQTSAESTSLDVLIVVDDRDERIGETAAKDRKLIERILQEGVKKSSGTNFKLKVLDRDRATSKDVLAHYKELPVDPDATLFLYYSGHGGWDPQRGNHLAMQGGKCPLVRTELVAAMRDRNPRLIVLVTDCCNVFCPLKPPRGVEDLKPNWETMRCLLLRHRGIVDITSAAEGEGAWTGADASIFTLPFAEILCTPPQELDTNRDGFVHWQEVLPRLQRMTQDDFEKASKMFLKDYETYPAILKQQLEPLKKSLAEQTRQTVRPYSLASSWRLGVRVEEEANGQGLRIVEVYDHTAAQAAGLRAGDVIRELDGKKVKTAADFSAILAGLEPDRVIVVDFLRVTKVYEIKVRLPGWRRMGKSVE